MAVGKIDDALHFNGFDTYMDCGDSLRLEMQKMMLSTWLETGHMVDMRCVLPLEREVADDFDYVLVRHPDNKVKFTVAQESSNLVSIMSNATESYNEWTHIAICLDGSQAIIFINGQLGASGGYGQRIPCDSCQFWISSLGGNTRFYSGKIDYI